MNVLKKNKSDSDSSDSSSSDSSSDSSDDEDLPPVKRKIMPRITIERGTRYLEMIKREEKERLEELQKPKEKETPKYRETQREVQREAQRETPKNKEPKEKISIIMAQVKNEQIKNRNKKFTKSRFRKGGKKRELVDSAHSGLKSHTSKVVKRGRLRRTVRKGVAPLVRLLASGPKVGQSQSVNLQNSTEK